MQESGGANKAHHSTKHKFIRQKLRGAAQTMNYIMSTPLKTKKSAPTPRQRLRPVAATFLRQELQHIEHPEKQAGRNAIIAIGEQWVERTCARGCNLCMERRSTARSCGRQRHEQATLQLAKPLFRFSRASREHMQGDGCVFRRKFELDSHAKQCQMYQVLVRD